VGRQQAVRTNRAAVAEQQVRCYQLRLSGLSIRQIAKATELSVAAPGATRSPASAPPERPPNHDHPFRAFSIGEGNAQRPGLLKAYA
jgi:hypothetical protein